MLVSSLDNISSVILGQLRLTSSAYAFLIKLSQYTSIVMGYDPVLLPFNETAMNERVNVES
jgi:hypothetical protein